MNWQHSLTFKNYKLYFYVQINNKICFYSNRVWIIQKSIIKFRLYSNAVKDVEGRDAEYTEKTAERGSVSGTIIDFETTYGFL